MTHTTAEIMAMDADALQRAIALSKGMELDVEQGRRAIYGLHFVSGRWSNGRPVFTPVPNWPGDIGAAWKLVDEWTSAPVPNNGHHEVSLVYEDWDGTRPISWHCQFARFTEVESDFSVYYSDDCETIKIAICRAWLLWKAAQ